MRDGNAPTMARWLADDSHRFVEWEPDLSSQTGREPGGHPPRLEREHPRLPLGREGERDDDDVLRPGRLRRDRAPPRGNGLLRDGGASRGNLLSGEADHVILTVSRMEAEKGANPGYRAFFSNAFNVTRVLVLFFWEVILEWVAALRAIRRDVQPRGHRGGIYPFMRAAMCIVVRDLIVFGVLTDLMKGRPAIYATFSSYDEVAHHSGLERADTLEALRKLDQQFGRIERACRYASRPYEIVVLSDHGQTQGATFKQRNGYGLDDLVERSLESGEVSDFSGGDEQSSMVGHALTEATGRTPSEKKKPKNDVSDRQVVVLGSGNLGLVYLLEEKRRLTLEEIDERHPRLIPALTEHPHVGWVLVRSEQHGPVVLGRSGAHYLDARAHRGRRPARAVLPDRAAAPPPDGRLRARRRPDGRELLRPGARRGLRVRGAHLLPRRHRRTADPSLRPLPRRAAAPRGAARRRSLGARAPRRLASAAPGRGRRRPPLAASMPATPIAPSPTPTSTSSSSRRRAGSPGPSRREARLPRLRDRFRREPVSHA